MKHNGIDYKTSAVQYYLNNNESIRIILNMLMKQIIKQNMQ